MPNGSRAEYPAHREVGLIWLLLASTALAGSVRVTAEIGPSGIHLRSAVELGGDTRTPTSGGPGPTDAGGPVAPIGPIEVIGHDGRVLATASVPDEALHRTIVFPEGGGAGARLERAVVRIDVPWPEGAAQVRLAGRAGPGVALVPSPKPPPGDIVPIQETGPAEERLDLVFLGDGYQESELDDFADDVEWIVDYLLTIDPYGAYSGMFNIWRVDVPSVDSGVSHDESGISRDTAFGCYYGCAGIDRLICCDDATVMSTVDAALPGADGVMVLVNDPVYGGSGGFTYATSYVGRYDGHQVAAHELGHTLIGLWDEYGYGYDGFGDGPNCSKSDEGHWDAWLGTDGVDAWQECSYNSLYRPTEDGCMMRSLRDDYCPICREQAVLAMYSRLPGLIVSTDPPPGEYDATEEDVTLTVVTNGPDKGLVYEWILDDEVVGTAPELELKCSGLNGEISLRVYDDTHWVRADPDGLLQDEAGNWLVTSEKCAPSALEGFESCEGCNSSGRSIGWAWLLGSLALLRRRGVPRSRR